MPEAFRFDQIPSRERQRIKILYGWTRDNASEVLTFCQGNRGCFRLSGDDEVARVGKEMRKMRRRRAEKAHSQTTRTGGDTPFALVPVINQ
jgi:hypothetical protein